MIRIIILLIGILLNNCLAPLAHAQSAQAPTTTDPKSSKNITPEEAYRTYRETNYVLYYDHSCTSSGSSSSGPGDAGGCGKDAANDPENMKQIFDYLTKQFQSKGFNEDEAHKAAAGIMGNWRQESQLNSYISGGSGCGDGPAVGIAQWCFGRADKLREYAASKGKPVDCLGVQLEFVWNEFSQSNPDLITMMKGVSAGRAANIFDDGGDGPSTGVRGFEESIASDNATRANNAEDIFHEMTGGGSRNHGGSSSASPLSNSSSGSSSSDCKSAAKDNGECKNPFRDLKNSGVSRIDGGYDYGGAGGSGSVYAACPAEIVLVSGPGSSGWPGAKQSNNGWYIKYKMTSGKAKDLFIYIAEDCPAKVKVGDKVDTNTPICEYQDQGTNLETGWASGGGGTGYVEWSDYHNQCGGDWASNSGMDFDKFMQSLGAPHDNVNCGPSTVPPPPDWPKWDGISAKDL